MASAFSTSFWKMGGSLGTNSAMGGGGLLVIWNMMVAIDSPRNGRSPASISYKTTPSENRSDRPSTFLPATCSGDM